jgi:predicted  nucleic acid-binding Zn-ribbon protein
MAKSLPSVTPPSPPGGSGRLGEKVEQTIERVIAWSVNVAGDAVSAILRRGIELLLEVLAEILAPYAQNMHDEIAGNPAVPQFIKDALRRPSANTDAGDAVFSLVYIVTAVVGGWRGLIAPSSRLSEQYVDKSLFSARPDPQAAWAMANRTEDVDFFREGMQELGWHPIYIDAWLEATRPRMAAVDLFRAAHRGEISFDDARRELQLQGWTADDVNTIQALTAQLPGAGDLIGMSVRGAFNPDEITEFELGAEFPAEFAEWMQRQGFSDEWSRRFWYSHWVLPPLSAGYEMFHRGIISSEQLDLLLKTQDISPFWRDKLRELSYAPLTRVDVRRMYGMGVLTRDDVVRSYLDLGYSPQNAERMTEFTIRYETAEDRDATKSDILAGFREGMLTQAEAEQWLINVGYGTDVAAFLVAREAAKLARDLIGQEIEIVHDLYTHREINEAEARTQLSALGLASNEINLKVADWSIARRAQVKRPTQDQASRFLRDDIITVSEFRSTLVDLGYQDQYIDWYLENVLLQKSEDNAKLEQAARDEQESIRLRDVKNDYQVAKAQLDVHIAELQTAIADIQLAMQARSTRYREERRIAEQLLTETEIRENAATEIADLESQIDAQREAIAYLRSQIDARQTTIADQELQILTQRADVEPDVEAVEAEIADLEAQQVGLRREIESRQTTIAEARVIVAEATADSEALRQDVSSVEAGIRDYDTRIDAAQTQIAEINLRIAQIKEALPGELARAATDEQRDVIAELAGQTILAAQTDIRQLQVEIEEYQDSIAQAREAVNATQEQIRELEAESEATVSEQRAKISALNVEIEALQDENSDLATQIRALETQIVQLELPISRTDTAIQQSRVVIEHAEDDIATANATIAGLNTQINARREQLRQQLDLVTRVATLEQVEAEYNASILSMEQQLSALKLELLQAREQKAQLQLDYREDLVT